jgi:hypothetical protein
VETVELRGIRMILCIPPDAPQAECTMDQLRRILGIDFSRASSDEAAPRRSAFAGRFAGFGHRSSRWAKQGMGSASSCGAKRG